jgi:hypothetical protein
MAILNDPEHWRDRANEVRASAESVQGDETRRVLLRAAETYERFAQRAQRLLYLRRRFVVFQFEL